MSGRVAAMLPVLVAGGLLAGGAWTNAAGAVIHGCANNHSGALRVAAHCAHNEHMVTWNVRGPAGPRGNTGPQGPQGLQGAPGTGGTASGTAGGALSGTYPNPSLKVSGGPCPDGQTVTDISAMASLTCAPGVYSDASNNVAAAPDPFAALTTGYQDTAVGVGALTSTTSAFGNTAMGYQALNADSSGFDQTAYGAQALEHYNGNAETAVGGGALQAQTVGLASSAFGSDALGSLTGGSFDTALGFGAGSVLTGDESSDIDIGNSGIANQSNAIHIGSATDGTDPQYQDALYIAAAESNIGAEPSLEINTLTGQIGIETSSERFKTDIRPLSAQLLNRLMALEPVSFRYKSQYVSGANPLDYGLIAEQVAKVYPNLVAYSDGKPYTVLYQELPVLLLAEVQTQQRQISQLESEDQRLGKLQAEVTELMRHAAPR